MQRIFSTFPAAMPGVGLLVLRLFLGTAVVIHSVFYLSDQMNRTPWNWLGGLAGAVCGVFILIGFLTPVVSVLVLLTAIVILVGNLIPLPFALSKINPSAVCSILVATAVIFLGPGAFSIDARLFGRREIIIPPSNPRPTS